MKTMTDRELLEAAAKAAGIEVERDARGFYECEDGISGCSGVWNPLEDDGDALRLAVRLGLSITRSHCECCIGVSDHKDVDWLESIHGDALAATRRAIVRAAAAIGEQK